MSEHIPALLRQQVHPERLAERELLLAAGAIQIPE